MTPINNSDLAWLVVSDYNQDNDIGYPDALREDIYNPEINTWCWEYDEFAQDVGRDVGTDEDYINTRRCGSVGDRNDRQVGGVINSESVGDVVGYRKIGKLVGSNFIYDSH